MADTWVDGHINDGWSDGHISSTAPNSLAADPMNMTPQEKTATDSARKQFIANEGSIGTRIRNTSLGDMATNIVKEPARFAQEVVTAPLSVAKKAAYGYGALGSAYNTWKNGGSLDDALRSGTQTMQGYKPIQGLMDSSMIGEGISSGLDALGNKIENATGNTGWGKAGLQAAADIATLLGATKAGKIIAENPKAVLGSVGIGSNKNIRLASEEAAPKILTDYQKAIRPSVKGTAGSANQLSDANANYVNGVYDVVNAKNKGVIQLPDEATGEVASRLPKTLQEHLDATSQARMDAFNEYNNMKIQAEDNGVTIDLSPIAQTLRQAASDPSLNVARPGVSQYMRDMADRLDKQGSFTPDQAQNAITKFNSVLDYSKVAPEIAENAMVDKSVAAQLRQAQNDAILNDGNPGYQEARLKYGRLAQMEQEAAHRARVVGRQAPSSLFDGVMGGLTSGEIVSGLLTANPALLARGAGIASFKYWRNKMNSPDHQIQRMYRNADRVNQGGTQ